MAITILPNTRESSSRFQQFRLVNTWGDRAPHLVDYVILAEFDIDSGSTVKHAYPSTVPGCSDNWFAEHMLPEGAHNRSHDWTVIFLRRDRRALDEGWANCSGNNDRRHRRENGRIGTGEGRVPAEARAGAGAGAGGDQDFGRNCERLSSHSSIKPGGSSRNPGRPGNHSQYLRNDTAAQDEGLRHLENLGSGDPGGGLGMKRGAGNMGTSELRGLEEDDEPFLYGINLVWKRDDAGARRGAVVKAMCICTRYNFIEVFRPLLLVALEQYFRTPVPDVLQSLYMALNSVDLSGTPRPTPWERRLMRRGMADTYMGFPPVEHLAPKWTYTVGLNFPEDKPHRLPLPLYTLPDETLQPSITPLIRIFGQSVMTIYNAVLTGKRVLFVGYNHPAGEICEIVLAACALVSPPFEGVLRRAFPYASLSDLSFLETKGFVAGVTNPMFESRPEWWDVLCQLDLPNQTGNIVIGDNVTSDGSLSRSRGATHSSNSNISSSTSGATTALHGVPTIPPGSIGGGGERGGRAGVDAAHSSGNVNEKEQESASGGRDAATSSGNRPSRLELESPPSPPPVLRPPPPPPPPPDKDLQYPGDSAFATRLVAGVRAGKGESWARCECQDYTQGLLNLALDKETCLAEELPAPEPLLQMLGANGGRLQLLKSTWGIREQDLDPWWRCGVVAGERGAKGQGAQLRKHIRRLELEKNMDDGYLREVFALLSSCLETEAELQVLLGLLPESKGGVQPIALALYSADASTRQNATTILRKLESFPSTRPAVACMNEFLRLTYERNVRGDRDDSYIPLPGDRSGHPGGRGGGGGGFGGLPRIRGRGRGLLSPHSLHV